MDDTELFAKLLRIAPPWRVTRVSVDVGGERVDVWVEEMPGTKFACAVCRAPAPVYDPRRPRRGGTWTPVSTGPTCTPGCPERPARSMA